MPRKYWWRLGLVQAGLAAAAWGATLGRVVPIGGQASDLALDETRGVVYVANFTANRIDVVSTADLAWRTSMNVAAQPSSLALSPDGRFLLVTHTANYQPPETPLSGLTLIRLEDGSRQTLVLKSPPLGAAFTNANQALLVTTTEFILYSPDTGQMTSLATVEEVALQSLPAPPASFPPQIIAASVAASGDGERIYGLTDTFRFRFDRYPRRLSVQSYVSEPPQGPRVVSVSRYGSYYAAGWGLFDARGTLMAQFPEPAGLLQVGSHAIDSDRGLIFAQIPANKGDPPVLTVADADNLTVRERFNLPENLAGKSVLSRDGAIMYSISESGLMVLPVGAWEQQRRIVASAGQVLFRSSFCERQSTTQEVWVEDASGGNLGFTVTGEIPGISVTPLSGVTPAVLQIRVDPAAFNNRSGTVEAWLEIQSPEAVNAAPGIRVLVNLRQPDQRGTVVPASGQLVDILADPVRNRFFVLRQDKNQVLVYDGAGYQLLATLRTGNTPTQMAFTFDRRYLLVGNDNSQIANVYDLETLEAGPPIRFPAGHYPRSLAASGRAILAACRVAGPAHTIDRVDFGMREAVELPSLGVWENTIDVNTVLVGSPNGASIMAAGADGSLWLYNATADTFTVSRKDFESLEGAYAASNYGQFVVDNLLLNSSLVSIAQFEKGEGRTASFAFVDGRGLLTIAGGLSSPGVIQRIDLTQGAGILSTRMAEAPLTGRPGAAFRRSLAVLADGSALVSLTDSGFTVLAAEYDAAAVPPRIEQVVNAADFTRPVAPGGLISAFGRALSPLTLATSEMPLPRALGESCLTANGAALPMLFVSPGQINAQLPFEAAGNVTLVLHTPGGVSDSYSLQVQPFAPAVFRSGTAGPVYGLPTVFHAANHELVTPANPIHKSDRIVIYLTGLGGTLPAVEAGEASPLNPLAVAAVAPVVTLAGLELPVSYAGLTPGYSGLYQINADVPDWVPTGLEVPLGISQGGASTIFAVRVVQ